MLAVQADGTEIVTIEGIAREGKLHPVQEAFYEQYGAQCGFCTSGQVITACALLRSRPRATEDEIREAMSGVLCRCTGYYHIIESVKAAQQKLGMGTGGPAPS
jgi:carbon-monoxide dehydrogenase small subunit